MKLTRGYEFPLVNLFDELVFHPFNQRFSLIELIDVLYLARLIICGLNADALRFHAEIDVFGNNHHTFFAILACQVVGNGKDAMVGLVLPEKRTDVIVLADIGIDYDHAACFELYPLVEESVSHQ